MGVAGKIYRLSSNSYSIGITLVADLITRLPMKKLVWFFAKTVLFIVLISSLLVLSLRWYNPETTAFMVANKRALKAGGAHHPAVRHQWVNYEDISPAMALAVVASEDQLFPRHYGFDTKAIKKAYSDIKAGRDFRGASSITQQTMKNMYLWRGQSMLRKGLEAWLTVLAELYLSKRRILEIYLNIAQFDGNTFGVGAASSQFFAKPAANISASEAALLAVALPAPSRYRVEAPSEYMRERQNWVLNQMAHLGDSYLADLE